MVTGWLVIHPFRCRERREEKMQLTIWILKQNLAIDSSGSNQSRVERLDFVGGHNYFHVASVVETIELIEEFEHGSLDLALASRGRLVSLGADGVDLVDEDDGRGVFGGHLLPVSFPCKRAVWS